MLQVPPINYLKQSSPVLGNRLFIIIVSSLEESIIINNNAPKCGKALLGFILARKDNASDDMWVKAAEMEDNVDKKKKLLIKKLTGSPNSTLLWNKLI